MNRNKLKENVENIAKEVENRKGDNTENKYCFVFDPIETLIINDVELYNADNFKELLASVRNLSFENYQEIKEYIEIERVKIKELLNK